MRNLMLTILAATAACTIAFCAFPPATASAEGASLDLDVLSSVVRIEVDGTFAGTGVVVTRGGLVIVPSEIAMAILRDRKRVVIVSDLPKAASAVSIDAANGLALLQMHGVIPRPASLADRKTKGTDLAVCKTEDGGTVQMETRGTAPIADCDLCPVFSPKTGRLKAVMNGTRYLDAAVIRKLLGNDARQE